MPVPNFLAVTVNITNLPTIEMDVSQHVVELETPVGLIWDQERFHAEPDNIKWQRSMIQKLLLDSHVLILYYYLFL